MIMAARESAPAPRVTPVSLPPDANAGDAVSVGASDLAALDSERTLLLTAIESSRWNMTHAAERLGISRNTLYRKIKQFGIPLPHARQS